MQFQRNLIDYSSFYHMLVCSAAITRYQSPSSHQRVQHITLCRSIDWRTIEWQFCFTKHKLNIVPVFNNYFVVEVVGMFVIEFSLILCRFHQTLQPSRITSHESWLDLKTINWTWFPLKMQGVIHCYHFRIQSFYFSLCFALILWLKVSQTCFEFPHEMALILSTLRPWRRITNCKLPPIKVNSEI